MKIKKQRLDKLIKRYLLKEAVIKGAGGYEYEKRGNNIYIVRSPSRGKINYRVKPGTKAHTNIAKRHYPELLTSTAPQQQQQSKPSRSSSRASFKYRTSGILKGVLALQMLADEGRYKRNDIINQEDITRVGPIDEKNPKGPIVAAIQVGIGLTGSSVDGIYGPNTQKQVQNFKVMNGLATNIEDASYVGQETAKLMLKKGVGFALASFIEDHSDEIDLASAKKPDDSGITYWSMYDYEIKGGTKTPSSEKDLVIARCTQDGCSQWVSDTFGKQIYFGNAWHAHFNFANIYSGHKNLSKVQIAEVTKLFNTINQNPVEKAYESEAKAIVQGMIPDQSIFSNLALGDVVGLYYDESSNFTKAFYEGATGKYLMGDEGKAHPTYFVDGVGNWWAPDAKGQTVEFFPGKTLSSGNGFGMNTHIGVVGAMHNGIPIIYHNVHKSVHATGLNAMSSNDTAILWAGKNPRLSS